MSKISNVDKKKEIIGVILILIALLLLIGFYSNTDAFLLVFIRNLVNNGIGVGGYVLPIIVGFIGIGLITKKKISNLNKKFYALISFLIMIYLIISLVTLDKFNGKTYLSTLQAVMSSTSNFHGGVLGITVMRLFKSFIGFAGSLALLITILVISIILIFDKSLYDIAQIIKKKINRISNKRDDINSKSKLDNLTNTKNNDINFNKKKKSNASIVKFLSKSLSIEEPQEISNIIKKEPDVEFAEEVCEEPIVKNVVEEDIVKENYNKNELISNDLKKTYEVKNEYKRISYDDINNALEDTDINDFNEVSEELKRKKDLLQKTLDDFKVKAEIKNVQKGPAVTRYEIEPHKGVKVSKILNLSDDIALALATSGIRIEAPIPGKSLVGIEVPNDVVSMIKLKEIINSEEFDSSKLKISIGLGKDISGKSIVADLATMPHLLIAGATGSGKSVCINTILISILCKYLPDQVKIILIDPKVVELNVYNGIPHLLIPVVTDPKKASHALNWAISEMTSRYNKFAEKGVRNIDSYNELYNNGEIDEKIPYIVIVIDELADLMMVCHNEVEDAIARLAQMARAAGMHLVIATQRPSVDVITGVIKANIPSRISFSVSSSIDSRTILDQSGAEKLLGRGDMLFYPMGYLKPQRIQGAFISESEVEKFVNSIKNNYESKVEYNEEIIEHINNATSKVELGSFKGDELLEEAIKIVVQSNNTSTSFIQRKLKIGYNRAANLMEEIEARGIIGIGSSGKKEVLVREEDLF
ncbi:DNA translocase FtsK/SpoIIIE [Candidatus Arthromitus sp. SFB-mouse-Japan]|nr:DNA translocase FtsK [Candidatus Arthromitus sp. SFB-mouse]EIA27491.1 Putative stage III sporulation protein E [Candidatus Arthromitus sp. SFB-co]EIA29138.1 Putative stage III sporulation protein E [Candidatus Arthromitus sp. SFB-4]EIA30796.1 Putative stage III sporulation protein E [Candidatus Arthromitus sp. SFB-mouse-SU]BAK79843.1 DNA translocase FtsK/SpoIIIE [Candidatus Arthromitus sp. SFB-mouse-Yit]BAK56512.1 DNA translocase FtsK/SpoIIIE [Candidatus Arthromitus sp. SFB-mouse-Japan]